MFKTLVFDLCHHGSKVLIAMLGFGFFFRSSTFAELLAFIIIYSKHHVFVVHKNYLRPGLGAEEKMVR